MESLDPRITRLNIPEDKGSIYQQKNPEQFITFEVFLQKRENMPYEHAGIVHAPDETLALILAKEQFSRRFTCTGMMVANTKDVLVSPYTDLEEDIYDLTQIEIPHTLEDKENNEETFSIFHLTRRGKQHKHVGTLIAKNFQEAFSQARIKFKDEKPVLNMWIIRSKDLFSISDDDKDIWNTLPEKVHRDVTSYRAKDKIDNFKAEQQSDNKGGNI